MQIQERIGSQVVDALMEHLNAKGAACVIEAQHMCMTARGVENQTAKMRTSALRGVFLENAETRAEFLQMIKGE
jgi:GTP cyclohydrolase I